jgi:predicted CoA-binding protein
MEKKHTVVIGASPNTSRYSYRAVEMLKADGHPVEAVGLREGEVSGVKITKEFKPFDGVNTVSLYVGPRKNTLKSSSQNVLFSILELKMKIFRWT